MKSLVCLFIMAAVVSCASGKDANDLPPQYKSQISTLRSANIEIAKKCQDLQKQLSDLQAQQMWNQQRMNTVAGEALLSLGLSGLEYTVNIDRMKIEKKNKERK